MLIVQMCIAVVEYCINVMVIIIGRGCEGIAAGSNGSPAHPQQQAISSSKGTAAQYGNIRVNPSSCLSALF